MTYKKNETHSDRSTVDNKGTEDYSAIKVPEAQDTYLEITSGKDDNAGNTWQTPYMCNKCGLTARNKQELQDHINNAHRETISKG